MNNKVIIFADGGCRNNQSKENIGGWGAVLIAQSPSGEELLRKEIYGGQANTTNNIMELTATIRALKCFKREDMPIEVFVDSNYVYQGITQWIDGWKARGWRKSNKKPVENIEHWKALDEQVQRFDKISFFKTQAHVGIELNELADNLANKGMDMVGAK